MAVALFDTAATLEPLREQLRAAIDGVLESERFILGPEVAAFEQELAAYCGAAHGVGVANGTDAITIALRAMGVGPGDEVIVPSFTFYASAEAIPPTGARPVFCDIDPDTYCVTAETVRAALTPRTKAVVVVHLFGNVAPVAEIEALGVPVLEDAAQALGSESAAGRPGALGRAATFSFYPSKNLGCFGDGGMIVTGDERIAEQARILRFHGSRDKVDLRAARLQLAPGRAAGGNHARAAAASAGVGQRAGARPGATTKRQAWASSSGCPCRSQAQSRRGTCTSSAIPSRGAWKPRSARRGSGTRLITACPCIGRRRWRSGVPGSSCRGPSRPRHGIWRFR